MSTEWVSKEEPHEPTPLPIPHDLPEYRDGHEWYGHGPEGESE